MQVYVYKGDWGLPSVDFDCLKVLSFIKLSKAPVDIKIGRNPYLSPTGFLPYLEDTGANIKIGGNKIIEYLKAQGYACNSDSSAISAGYEVYIYENLFPYFTYSLWGEPSNADITRMIYAKRMRFPFSFYYPKKYVERTNNLTETLYNFSLDDKIEMHDVLDMNVNAKKCLNWLSDKLGENNHYFLGANESELDASIYAYLAVILHHTLLKNELQNHVKNCPNLVKYVEHFTKLFSPEECSSSEENASKSKPKNGNTFHTGQEDDEHLGTKRRRQLFAGLFAMISMSTYAFFSGIVQIPGEGSGRQILHKIEYDDE